MCVCSGTTCSIGCAVGCTTFCVISCVASWGLGSALAAIVGTGSLTATAAGTSQYNGRA